MYRNEDTGWGWPPYFKFNSADVTAQAQSLAGETEKSWVLVTYYGWRVTLLSHFPNAIGLEKVNKDYRHLPLFNIFFLFALAIGVFFCRSPPAENTILAASTRVTVEHPAFARHSRLGTQPRLSSRRPIPRSVLNEFPGYMFGEISIGRRTFRSGTWRLWKCCWLMIG